MNSRSTAWVAVLAAACSGTRAQTSRAVPPAAGPLQQLARAQQLLSPTCVGCVSQCASQIIGESMSQPAMRAITMFGYRHLFWNDEKECAEFGEGLSLVFKNLQLWHVVVLFTHFYLQCTNACHSKCPYWGQRGKVAVARGRKELESSADWVYKLGPSFAWEQRFAQRKREEARAEEAAASMS
jgi:hypothetical protein